MDYPESNYDLALEYCKIMNYLNINNYITLITNE